MKLIFVRHGATSANEQHLYCGKTNPGLSVAGKQQASAVSRILKNRDIDVWMCGPSKRTMDTIGIIFDELVLPREIININPDIREINFGLFENYSYEEISIQFPVQCADYLVDWQDYTFPGGDNTKAYFDYCAKSLSGIISRNIGQNICIVGHKGYIASALCAINNLDIDRLFDVEIGCGELIETEIISVEAERDVQKNISED